MRTVPLQQICDIQIGKTPSRSVPEYWGGELPWVTISDFAAGRIVTTTQERITRIGAAKSGSKRIPRGTLLLSFKLSLGKRALSGCDLFTNEAIAALHVLDHDVADRDYLYWALGSIDYDRLVDRAAKGKTLNKAKLKILKIPLPPLDKQKRIAGILDAADALRAKRREALAQLDTLLQSTFLDMFGDPVTNPMGWKTPALSEVTDEIYRYPTYFGIVYENEGVLEIRGELIGKGGKLDTDPSKLRFIAQATSDKFPRTQLAAGDLVMSVRGTIGKIGIVPAELINANMTANLIRISSARSIIDPVFLLHLALGPYFLDQLSRASSSTTVIKTIKSLDIKAIPIPLPPLDLQRRFAAIVESFEHQKASQRAHLAELDTLFASLQSRAFRGDL